MSENAPTQSKICHAMGFCLFCVQAAERAIASAIEIALPPNGVISVQSLEGDEEQHRQMTIGGLVKRLNRRARIDPGLAQRLASFISRRNQFVHHFGDQFGLESESGRAQAVAFCEELASDALRLAELFYAVSFAVVEKLEHATGRMVRVDWDGIPKEASERLKELGRFLPAIIREPKG